MIKYIDLSKLPRTSDGKINWVKSVNHIVPFIYGDIRGNITLIDYIPVKQTFKIFIDGYTKYQYDTVNIDTLKQCKLGRLLHKKIIDTDPELVQYFVDANDALKYSSQSNIRTNVKCPLCGYQKTQIISNLYQYGFSCPQCSDGVSYPNKLMFSILQQLGVEFKNEITKRDRGFEWVGEYRYDFYFVHNNCKYFVEMDGHFHKINRMGDIKQIAKSDAEKDVLAQLHNVELIRIDCCYPNEKNKLSFIKNNIIDSKLYQILPLDNLDWALVNSNAMTSNIKLAAECWDAGYTIKQIAQKIGVSRDSITNYLKIAAELGLCKYNKETSEARRILACKLAKSKSICTNDQLMECFQTIQN